MVDITTVAAWGEFLGGIGVIISLVYLASQIRQNSKLLRASAVSTTSQIQLGQVGMTAQDPEVARIYWDGLEDRESLSDTDLRRFDPLMWIQMAGHNQRYNLCREELASTATREALDQELKWLLENPGVRQWWSDWRRNFEKGFCHSVEGLISARDATE